MLNYLKAFLVFFLWVAIALSSHYFITHQHSGNLKASIKSSDKEIKSLEATTLSNFTVKNGAETVFSTAKGFTIFKNSEKISSVDSISFLIDSIKDFLDNNYDKQLEILGKYTNLEDSNLGFSRANSLKNQLINKGIAQKKLKTSNKKESFDFNENGTFQNGIELRFITLNKTILDSLEYTITNKRLYVSIENEQLIESYELSKYVLILNQYLIHNPVKTVEIIGHTDNNGYYENNLIIGKNKANKLKEYFLKKGIVNVPISTFSRGEAEPIANKYTEEGKALNSRIEIKVN